MALQTTIKLSYNTKKKLKDLKDPEDETYDSLIREKFGFDDDSQDNMGATTIPDEVTATGT